VISNINCILARKSHIIQKKAMNKIFLIASLSFLVSCAVCKERRASKEAAQTVTTEVEKEEDQTNVLTERPMKEEEMIIVEGTVRLDRPGCPVSIDMVDGDLFSSVYPVNLDKKYHQEGLRLKFTYTPSRAASPESCTADMVVALDNIEIIK
jgi:hypothetical protein